MYIDSLFLKVMTWSNDKSLELSDISIFMTDMDLVIGVTSLNRTKVEIILIFVEMLL